MRVPYHMAHTVWAIRAWMRPMIAKNIFNIKAQTNSGGNGTGTQDLNRDTNGENTG